MDFFETQCTLTTGYDHIVAVTWYIGMLLKLFYCQILNKTAQHYSLDNKR